jgi:hypothetical protein
MLASMRKSRKKRNNSLEMELGAIILTAIVFLAAGIIFFFMILYFPLSDFYKSASWKSVPAVVTASKLAVKYDSGRRNNKVSYSIKIEYRYEFKGKICTGDRYDFFRSRNRYYTFGGLQMQQIVNHHPAGKKITCLVNPENPSESVISRELYYPALAFGIIPVTFLCIGISMVIYLILNLKRSKRK